jgi:hypothetical protein
MPALSRRRDPEGHHEVWHVYYGDVRVGTIGIRAGVPVDVDQWGWSCGFYPGVEPQDYRHGTARTFKAARTAFRNAWRDLLPTLTESNFQRWRDQHDFTSWNIACTIAAAGCRRRIRMAARDASAAR